MSRNAIYVILASLTLALIHLFVIAVKHHKKDPQDPP